jgi:hypothetical protein
MNGEPKLTALDPGDELYRTMPEHVRDVYRRAKAFRRQQDRRSFRDRQDMPPGLRSPEEVMNFLR